MADLYVRDPKTGEVVVIDDSQQQLALDQGFQPVDEAGRQAVQQGEIGALGDQEAVTQGLLTAPEGYESEAAKEKLYSAATFGLLPGLDSPEARARGLRFQEEHPGEAFAYEVAGQLPLAVASGALGEAAVAAGAAAKLGRAAQLGVRAADFVAQSALGGAQTEAEQTRLAADDFSWTDAAVAGLAGEAIGRGAGWAVSRAVGGTRNLLAKAEREAIADDVDDALTKGGWLNDFRVAHHAEQYQNELADLAARDLDDLQVSFEEVSRQDRKRARISKVVEDAPETQAPIRIEAHAGLQQLRDAVSAEVGDAPSGAARSLLKQIDDRIAQLEDPYRTGRRLWRTLDENRQALQEFQQDLHQAYENNPGAAWLSRDGLAAVDAAERQTREALLREDAWGRAAAEAQAAYNTPFHEKYFPTEKTVKGKLMFSPYKNERGFDVFQGDPAKVRAFFSRNVNDVDGSRLAEQFRDYLDGVEAIARSGEADAPKAARDTLERVRRLRKAVANAEYIAQAARRTSERSKAVELGAEVAGGVAAGAAAGPFAGAAAFGALRGARAGDWVFRAAQRLGWGAGEAKSMAKLLAKGELPGAAGADRSVQSLLDDLTTPSPRSPFGPASVPPPAPGVGMLPFREVGENLPPGPEALPGVGPTRLDNARVPAGAYAIKPQGQIDVGPGSAPPGTARPSVGPSEGPEELDVGIFSDAPARPTGVDELGPSVAPESRSLPPAERPTRFVGEREVSRGQAELLETEPVAEAGMFDRAQAPKLEALRAELEAQARGVLESIRAAAPDDELATRFADDLEENLDQMVEDELALAADRAERASSPTELPPASAAPEPRPADAGPATVEEALGEGWERVGPQAGSNEGGVFRSPGGEDWYAKVYDDPRQAQAEAVGNEVYRTFLGEDAAVESVVKDMPDGRALHMAKMLPEDELERGLQPEDLYTDQAQELARGFWGDVLLANWDVLGQDFDNVIFRNGRPVRVDNGSSLMFRAMGDQKSAEVLGDLSEITGFFDRKVNPNYAAVLKRAGYDGPERLLGSLKQLLEHRGQLENIAATAPPELGDLLVKRLDLLEDFHRRMTTGRAQDLRTQLGASYKLGAMFKNQPNVANRLVDDSKELLEAPPPELDVDVYGGSTPLQNKVKGLTSDANPFGLPEGLNQVRLDTAKRYEELPDELKEAVQDWIGSSHTARTVEQTGVGPHWIDDQGVIEKARLFPEALKALEVKNPTEHGPLFRYIDLDERAIAELLSRDDYVMSAPSSTGYQPDPNFGNTRLVFRKVDRAGGLYGINPGEHEMVLPAGGQFRKVAEYYDPEKDGFTFVFEQGPNNRKLVFGDYGHLTIPAAVGVGAAATGAAQADGSEPDAAAASAAPVGGFAAAASLLKAGRGRLVKSVARALFAAAPEATLKTVARLAYSRSQLAARQEEFQAWQANPQELVDRVAEGLSEAPPEAFAKAAQGVFAAASFLREKLPQSSKPTPVGLSGAPVSSEAAAKYARYEQAALRPRDALREAAQVGYLSPELLETLQTLYPDLLAEVRVEAYQAIRETPHPTVQARTTYARLFDGDGALADPAFSSTAVQMANLAFQQAAEAAPPKAGAGPRPGVSQTAAAVQAPAPYRTA